VKALSQGSDLAVGLLTAIPFALAAIGMVTIATHSDRTGERKLHVAACAAVAAFGLGLGSQTTAPVLSLAALSVAAVGLYGFTPPFWSLPTAFLRGDGAAAGIALINATGNLGGFIGPYVMGRMTDLAGTYRAGLALLAGTAILSGILVMTLRIETDRRRK